MKKIFGAFLLSILLVGNFILPFTYSQAQFAGFNFVGSSRAENEIVVNRVEDLPKPSDLGDGLGTAYRLDSADYIIADDLTLAYPIAPAADGNSSSIKFVFGKSIEYTGTGAFIRANTTTAWNELYLKDGIFVGDGTNTFYSVNGDRTQSIYTEFCIVTDFTSLGEINNQSWLEITGNAFQNYDTKLSLDNNIEYASYGANAFEPSNSLTGASIEIDGDYSTDDSRIAGSLVYLLNSNQNFLDIKSSYQGSFDISHNFIDTSLGGTPFASGSLDQTSINGNCIGNAGIPDSQTIGSLYMERNTTATNPTIQGSDGDITAFADAGGGQVTVTSASHGLSNGDILWIIDGIYTGKYTISNVATNTFEITATYDGTETAIWETGWTKVAGTTYPLENERASMTANNKITFTNLESKKVTIHASTNPKNSVVAAAKDWELTIMKNGVERVTPIQSTQMTDKTTSLPLLTTNEVISGDYFELYTRNLSDTTTDMVMENMSLVIE